MNMDKIDKQLIESFCKERNLKKITQDNYKTTISAYTTFQEKQFHELLKEALTDEQNNIPWKQTKLRERLINFRVDLLNKGHVFNTVKSYMTRIQTFYEEGFDIEIGKLPRLNQKNIIKPTPITFKDLPDKELIKQILKLVNPLMRAIILFMVSSGCARRETLNITIGDFITATKEYHSKNDIYEVLKVLSSRNDVIPLWKLKRQKTNKYYSTFSSPESTTEIVNYLLSEERILKNNDPLFNVSSPYFNAMFNKINDSLQLGKAGTYNRFRSHMLRKFHASQLYNDGLGMSEIDELQGRGKDQTRTSYFLEDPFKLREKYIEHINAITINLDVNTLDLKSPEYVQLESELENKEMEVAELKQKYELTIEDILKRVDSLEKKEINSNTLMKYKQKES